MISTDATKKLTRLFALGIIGSCIFTNLTQATEKNSFFSTARSKYISLNQKCISLAQGFDQYIKKPILNPYIFRIKTTPVSKWSVFSVIAGFTLVPLSKFALTALRNKSIVKAVSGGAQKHLNHQAALIYAPNILKIFSTNTKKHETTYTHLSQEELEEFEKHTTQQQKEILETDFESLKNTIWYGPPGTGKTTLYRAYGAKNKNVKLIRYPKEAFESIRRWQEGEILFPKMFSEIENHINATLKEANAHCAKAEENRVIFIIEEADSIKITKLFEEFAKDPKKIKDLYEKQKEINATKLSLQKIMKEDSITFLETTINNIITFLNRTIEEKEHLDQRTNIDYKLINFCQKINSKIPQLKSRLRDIESLDPEELINRKIFDEFNIIISDLKKLVVLAKKTTEKILEFKILTPIYIFFASITLWKQALVDGQINIIKDLCVVAFKMQNDCNKIVKKIESSSSFRSFFSLIESEDDSPIPPIEQLEESFTEYMSLGSKYTGLLLTRLAKSILFRPMECAYKTSAKKEHEEKEKIKKIFNEMPIPGARALYKLFQNAEILLHATPPDPRLRKIPQILTDLNAAFFRAPKTNQFNLIAGKTRCIITTNGLELLDPMFLNGAEYEKTFTKIKIDHPSKDDIYLSIKDKFPQINKTNQELDKNIKSFARRLYVNQCCYREIEWAVEIAKRNPNFVLGCEQAINAIQNIHARENK